jgi:predicted nucleotidyltransferase
MNPAKPTASSAPPAGLVITADEWQIVRAILQRHVPEREVWAFGSRAKATTKRFADLDLAILGGQPLSLQTLADMAEDFSESDLSWKVDLVDWATTSAEFKKIIAANHIALIHG